MHLRAAYAQDAQLRAPVLALKAWQAARLARTYTDLLASPRYHDAAQFFSKSCTARAIFHSAMLMLSASCPR